MKHRFFGKRKKKDDEEISDDEFPERIPYRLGTVISCEPSPTAEGKPEAEKVYVFTIEIDETKYRGAQPLRLEAGQKVIATTVGDIAIIDPTRTKELNADREENET